MSRDRTSRESTRRASWILGTIFLFAFATLNLHVDNTLTHFMPSGEEVELAAISRQLIDSGLSRTMVLSIGEGDQPTAIAAELARSLGSNLDVAAVHAGLDDVQLASMYEIYSARLPYFLSDDPEAEVPKLITPAGLRERARSLKSALAGPSSAFYARAAPLDPLSIFPSIYEGLESAQPTLRLEKGQFVSPDGRFAFVFLETRASPFDHDSQKRVLDDIRLRFTEINAKYGGLHVLEQSGVNRFAVDTEDKIRSDVRFISILSVVGIVALFLVFFRSLRNLAVAGFPPLFGILFATSAGISAIDPLHGVTLGFGIAMIGVSIDYPIHVLNHHMLAPDAGGAKGTVRRLRASLTLGAMTTIASFLGLMVTTFPGVGEMGLFSALGIGAALVATLFGMPLFIKAESSARGIQIQSARVLAAAITWITERQLLLLLPLGIGALIAVLGIPAIEWQDDPSGLSALDPELEAEDQRVRSRVSHFDPGRLVISVADGIESAIALNDRVYPRLKDAIAEGEVDAIRSLHSILWSRDLQERNLLALQSEPGIGDAIEDAFVAEGFRPGTFDSFGEQVSGEIDMPPPLGHEDLAKSPLGSALRTMLVSLGDRHAAITYLRGVKDPDALAQRLEGLNGVHYFDRSELMRELYSGYRIATQRVIIIGTVLVYLVLLARYRRPREALAAFIPSVVVALATLGALSLFSVPVDILMLISLILVMGMGVDYSIFIVDSANDPKHLAATLASLLFSCTTTLLVFGILALSSQPPLRSIGITTGLGIVLAFLLAPTSLLLLPATRRRGDSGQP